jgi:hypothetical protein
MRVKLDEGLFSSHEYTVNYSNKRATFIIVDEEFQGINNLGRVNRVNCVVRELDEEGGVTSSSIHPTVIGMSDGVVGVACEEPALRGELMTHENMGRCTVILYE